MNLSKAETEKLKSLSPTSDDLQSRFRTTFAQILSARLNAYVKAGLAGEQSYVRDNGNVVNPAAELRTAIRSLAFLADEFPGFVDALGKPSSSAGSALTQNYYWMERPVDKENVLVLSAEQRQKQAKAAVGADLHFYASRDYNSMLTLIGVVPYGGDWMVFAINHTFTDRVTGFGSTVRRAVGRDLVATELGKHLRPSARGSEVGHVPLNWEPLGSETGSGSAVPAARIAAFDLARGLRHQAFFSRGKRPSK